ncbi:MAG: hypothetical protein KF716_02350 [Anaerolineae bacterium]|nr:hypothetical protein [Anaerolineae bacterium]
MSSQFLMLLMFTILGVVFILQGLPGLLSGELYLRGKYGRATRYTGNKAVAMGFGTVAFGLLIILNGLFLGLGQTLPKSATAMAGVIMGVAVYVVCWVISWFVSGTATRERTRSWWGW